MSSNNQLLICKIKDEWCVFENRCVDNKFRKPKSSKNAYYTTKQLLRAIRWVNKYCRENLVEYGYLVIG